MRYYIADNHFFHAGVNTRMDHRGFSDVETMNEYMIDQWNSRVRKNDEVVILGDLSIGGVDQTTEVIKRLKGRKYMIVGNHDKFLTNKFDASLFQFIGGYHEMNDNGRKVVLCHYPILCYNGQFRRSENSEPKVYMLHGHIHNTQDITVVEAAKGFAREFKRAVRGSDEPMAAPVNIINCFCMFSDYVPLTLDEWIDLEKRGDLNKPHADWRYDE